MEENVECYIVKKSLFPHTLMNMIEYTKKRRAFIDNYFSKRILKPLRKTNLQTVFL
jgi:hypothetical protein